ncbi:MAG: alpha/beta fold hydrolase [Mycobacterium sp.]
MAGPPSGFKAVAAQEAYCRLYDEALALSAVPVEESDVETSFGTTHVLTAGDPTKPPLVALHALAVSSTMWIPMLPTLTASHHVRMLDAVGDLNKSKATHYAMSRPERVERLALVGPAGIVIAQHAKWLATMIYRFQLRSITPASAGNAFDAWVMPQSRPRLRSDSWRPIAQQFITGMAERFRQQLPQARVRLVDDANHLVPIDQPDVVAEELRDFFGGP